MEVSLVDLILVIIVGGFVFYGAFFGFIHTLGSLIGALVGAVIASRIVDPVFDWIGFIFGGGTWARIIIFIIIFLIITKVVGVLFGVVKKVWSIVPFGKSLDRLLGLVLGFIEGVIVVGVILYFAMQYLPEEGLRSVLEMSAVSDYLLMVAGTVQILLPEALQQARDAVQNVEIPEVDLPEVNVNIEINPTEVAE